MYLAEVKACADHKELFSADSVKAIYAAFTSYYVPDGGRYCTMCFVAFRSKLGRHIAGDCDMLETVIQLIFHIYSLESERL